MKLKLKRTAAALLGAVMTVSSVNGVFAVEAETESPEVIQAEEDTISGTAVSADTETAEEEPNPETAEGSDDSSVSADTYTDVPLSMLPLEEVECALDLYVAYSKGYIEDFSAVAVSDVIAYLQDSDGNYIQDTEDAISDDDVIIWTYYKDDDGSQLTDKYSVAERTDTVDLTPPGDAEDFDIEIIAGSGNPLDLGNVRYIVRVFTSNNCYYNMSYEIYTQKDGVRTKKDVSEFAVWDDTENGTTILTEYNYIDYFFDGSTTFKYYVLDFDEEDLEEDMYIGLDFGILKRPGFELKIYEDYEYVNTGDLATPFYIDYYYDLHDEETNPGMGYSLPVNSTVLDVDMTQIDAGKKLFDNEYIMTTFYAVLVDSDGLAFSVAAYLFCTLVSVNGGAEPVLDSMYVNDNGVVKDVTFSESKTYVYDTEANLESRNIDVVLAQNYSASDNYFVKLKLYGETDEITWADCVLGVFIDGENGVRVYDYLKYIYDQYSSWGIYWQSYALNYAITVCENNGLTEIKEDLYENGYEACYSEGITFVIVLNPYYVSSQSGDLIQKVIVSAENFSSAITKFEQPVIGESDPHFRLQGVEDYDTYVIENGGHYTLDTYYGYGYQSVLINDENVDLSQVKPMLWSGYDDIFNLYQVSGSGSSLQDFDNPDSITEENQQYTLAWQIDETDTYNRNYWLTLVKKSTGGPKLFVNGPGSSRSRDVIFGESGGVDFGDSHTVMVANTGDEPMYVTAELTEDSQNVKIDEYWNLDGTYSLAAFTSVSIDSDYSKPDNIAKVVLVPDGDGEVSGTLIISSSGSLNSDGSLNTEDENYEICYIPLNGTKTNPQFSTVEIEDAVKYVPYQKIISTDNIYTDNKVTYSITEGELPEEVNFDGATGEIYGVPQETGDYTFTVSADFSDTDFESISEELTLTVLENTDENVAAQTDEGFEIIISVPDISVSDAAAVTDEVFEFTYDYEEHTDEYQNFWYDGQVLTENIDYDLESGSTKITIKSQTITDSGTGVHTIAGEYRTSGGEVKKAAQNFGYSIISSSGDDSGSSSSGGSSGSGSNSGDGSSSGGSSSSGSSSGGSSGGGGGGSGSSSSKYTVTFETNGGSEVAAQTVSRGSKISFLATPEKAGYSFIGWYTDEELTAEFDQTKAITASITLYAKWEQLSCRVWFNTNGGSEIGSVEILGDTVLEDLPEPEKENYAFAGWFSDEALTSEFKAGDKIYANTTLYAKWELIIPDEAPINAAGFIDVSENSWYYNDVNRVYGLGLMVGYNNALFGPDNDITLSNIVTVAAKLSGDDITVYESSEALSGIEENRWYTPYAKWAYEAGLAEGEFTADKKLSREDVAVMLMNYLEYKGTNLSNYDTEVTFADEELISESGKKAVRILYNMGILAGRGEGIIDPENTITRGEFAALVNRINNTI